MKRHVFEAVQVERNGGEAILDTFAVTKRRNADSAYRSAEMLCALARKMPHKPAAFVREVNTKE